MLEFPEVVIVSKQLNNSIMGKKVERVFPPSKAHKFCWYNGQPEAYEALIKGKEIQSVEGFGIFVEINFEGGYKLCFNDGTNVRLMPYETSPKDYQLLILLDNGMALVFTVAMYGGIYLHDGNYDNPYYEKSKLACSPFEEAFEAYYEKVWYESKPTLSIKAFLATEQRFPGIGNGVLQDILFATGHHPKQKIGTFSEEEKKQLLNGMRTVLQEMIQQGGRDTEKNIYGEKGGYKVHMCKYTLNKPCPKCGGEIVKETYLGGAVYYCSNCQVLVK